MISNCGHDENGKYTGGKAGDQTAKEYSVIPWYNRPWNVVLRFTNPDIANDLAVVAAAAANNSLVGYDQSQRLTYFQHLKASNWNPSKITIACEGDCSATTCANIIAVGYRKKNVTLQKFPNYLTTSSLLKALKALGVQELTDKKYLVSDQYLLPGDILLLEGHHVTINLSKGSKT